MIEKDYNSEEEFIKNYNPNKYEKPSVTVDTLIFTIGEEVSNNYRELENKELQILLIRRKGHPFKSKWAIPGGFVNIAESVDQAAARELKEETGVENVYLEQLYTWGEVNRDPRMRVISTSYIALVNKEQLKVEAGDDADDAKWFSISAKVLRENKEYQEDETVYEKVIELTLKNKEIELSSEIKITKNIIGNIVKTNIEESSNNMIAFDHGKIIYYALERLKNKIEYTDIAFNLMGEYFTLTELENVYEVILNKKFTAANFRRKIEHMVIETGKYSNEIGEKKKGHRPAKLYSFNPYWN